MALLLAMGLAAGTIALVLFAWLSALADKVARLEGELQLLAYCTAMLDDQSQCQTEGLQMPGPGP